MLLLGMLLLFCVAVPGGEVMDGRCEIVVPDAPGRVVFPPGEGYSYPAEFLRRHLRRLTGLDLPVVREGARREGGRRIYLGETDFARKRIPDLGRLRPEELVLLPCGADLVICGEVQGRGASRVDRGTLFGVYEYLEREYGVRWFFPASPRWAALGSGEIAAPGQPLRFPEREIRSHPRFGRRAGGVSYGYQPLREQRKWHPVLRFGDTLPHGNANHTQINWVGLYAESHPEYFARDARNVPQINLRHPKRTYVCLGSPAVLERMLENLRRFDRDGVDTGAWGPCPPTPQCVFFAANDGMVPRTTCHCPECARLLREGRRYEEQGSELFFSFVARYASRVGEAWPGRRLATLAYSHYLAPPETVRIPGNVDVTYVGPRIQYAGGPETYARHLGYARRWSGLLGGDRRRLSCWLNIVNPLQYVSAAPFCYVRTLRRWLLDTEGIFDGFFINGLNPYRRSLGEKGIWDAVQTFPMVYWQARLLWNPDADPDRLIDDYCDALYGAAAEEMKAFHRLTRERWEDLPQPEDDPDELAFIHTVRYPEEQTAELKRLLEQAARKADTPGTRKLLACLRDRVYGRFFRESELYHRKAGSVAAYRCRFRERPPDIGLLEQDPAWRSVPALRLAGFRWGEEPRNRTTVRLVHDGRSVFFLAELLAPGPQEDFRIQIADRADALRGQYSPNIQRVWKAFRELRILADGSSIPYGPFPPHAVRTAHRKDRWIVAGSWQMPQRTDPQGLRAARIQLLRYGGTWNEYDVWSPTLAGTTDYPTWRFGLLQLLPPAGPRRDGLE